MRRNQFLISFVLALVATIGITSIGMAASSAVDRSFVRASASDGVAALNGAYRQNNGFCFRTYQQGAARIAVYGGSNNKMVIIQTFQYRYGGRWYNHETWSKRTNTFDGSYVMTLKRKWYYDNITAYYPTRLKGTFRWYRNGVRRATRTAYSGVCYPN